MCDISLIVDWKNSHIMPNFEGKSQKMPFNKWRTD